MASEEDNRRNEPRRATATPTNGRPTTRGIPDGLRCVEFFSGIGGMRYGVERALREAAPAGSAARLASCRAYEISLHANRTYAANFRDARVSSKSAAAAPFSVRTTLVEQLRPADLDGVADLWTLSPPCQPFTNTRLAKRLDSDDPRCRGLKALVGLLEGIRRKPTWILLENVKHFRGSHMLRLWKDGLAGCGYTWEEHLLSPTQFGIPNHRTRYYMVCERSERFRRGVEEARAPRAEEGPGGGAGPPSFELTRLPTMPSDAVPMRQVAEYLMEESHSDDIDSLVVPDRVLEAGWSKHLGIVGPLDRVTHCFTAAYGRQLHRATGSLLLTEPGRRRSVREAPVDRDGGMRRYRGMLRRFAPSELLSLFGFPDDVAFPEDVTLEHRYKLVGNSVNVTVVSHVAAYLLRDVLATTDDTEAVAAASPVPQDASG